MLVCKTCGAGLNVGARSCPGCGSSFEPTYTTYPPSIIISGPDPETGEHVTRVSDPGARSESRVRRDGTYEMSVEGVGGVGRSGEARVRKTLRQRLAEEGTPVRFEVGRDDCGEDALVRIGDQTLTLQVVVAPGASDFWGEASRDSATTWVDDGHAARWLGDAIEGKARRMSGDQRAQTMLAVDARHAGFLASKPVLDEYARQFGDPASSLGFPSVWVVGPLPSNCSRIGPGQP